jgi:hypothetical protein
MSDTGESALGIALMALTGERSGISAAYAWEIAELRHIARERGRRDSSEGPSDSRPACLPRPRQRSGS